MRLSEELIEAIDGGEECRGRDSQLTEWARKAEAMEDALRWLYTNGHVPIQRIRSVEKLIGIGPTGERRDG